MPMSDIDISRAAQLKPIRTIANKLGIPDEAIEPYGHLKAKISPEAIPGLAERKNGKLILVTAISPTPAGEGKTTTTIGLGDALNQLGHDAMICLREPSLGPCLGMKGGATGGGQAQVAPCVDINLHFTGDIHAVSAAHNLMSAMIDNHFFWGNALDIDLDAVSWRRVVDMNDRALRSISLSPHGDFDKSQRQSGYDITVASEVMAVLCLADDLGDLKRRLGHIIVARTKTGAPVTAADLEAHEAMAALLKDAFKPNLVQTLENNPALIHGGPFANIAHGCNSVVATSTALKLADYVVTEAGFGADLGAEKFFDIKCRKAGLKPEAVVLVATVRALKMHGGIKKKELGGENVAALENGFANLARHVANLRRFGLPVLVGINQFITDTEAEIARLRELCDNIGAEVFLCRHWAEGGAGITELTTRLVDLVESGAGHFQTLYADDMKLADKIKKIACDIYGAAEVHFGPGITETLADWEKAGYGHYPVCMAKTQYSFSSDPKAKGAPIDHVIDIREVRLGSGAEFVVAICGQIMTMPGLSRIPAATRAILREDGEIDGLF